MSTAEAAAIAVAVAMQHEISDLRHLAQRVDLVHLIQEEIVARGGYIRPLS
jgi:hypothetical protein